jgi:hypothetical protein
VTTSLSAQILNFADKNATPNSNARNSANLQAVTTLPDAKNSFAHRSNSHDLSSISQHKLVTKSLRSDIAADQDVVDTIRHENVDLKDCLKRRTDGNDAIITECIKQLACLCMLNSLKFSNRANQAETSVESFFERKS